jgi:hypothetical protein
MSRRLAPLAAGAAVMLVATTIATIVQPSDEQPVAGPELSSALVQSHPAPEALAPAGPTSGGAVTAPPTTVPKVAPRTPKPAAPRAPAAPRKPATGGSAGDGTQAATALGWTKVGGDEFNGSKSSNWVVYEGAGHAGNGKRTADAISVENGSLVIRGDSNGNTGGMAWGQDQRFGKWEMRAKFPKGDSQYHPVLILWPNGSWPEGGEVDFAETNSAASDVNFFLHYSSSNQQKYAKKNLDLTQWHNYAVEWVDGRITGYIDGQKWFESTDESTLPPDKMHATIQLDYFPDGGSPSPTEMDVDYMRIYK